MSSRYGRNQKRAHRKRIADLEAALLEVAGVMTFQRNRADRLQNRIDDWARRIRRVCGEHHPFNEKVVEIVTKRLEPFPRVPLPIKVSFERIMSMEPYEGTATYIEAAAHQLEFERAVPADVPRAVFVLKSATGERSAYAIDSASLRAGRRDPEFVHYVTRQVGEQLAAALG